jgi:hypothetical protein
VRVFQSLSDFYTRVVHNATMGCRPGHPLMRDILLRIAERYPDRPKRYPLPAPHFLANDCNRYTPEKRHRKPNAKQTMLVSSSSAHWRSDHNCRLRRRAWLTGGIGRDQVACV